MEYPSKENFNLHSVEINAKDEGSKRMMSSSYLDDNFCNVAAMTSFDANFGWCSSPISMNDLLSPSFFMSPFNAEPAPSFANQYNSEITTENGEILGDKLVFHGTNEEFYARSSHNNLDRFISRPLKRSLSEKLLTALHLFKEEAGGGILAQVWLPLKEGDHYMLSTCEQPYLLDQTFSEYREISRLFTFSVESKLGCNLGLPGRVFSSKIPEWTSNVLYYNKAEYLRVQYAADYEVRGSIALPVLECDSVDTSCCAVIELVTKKEKSNFDSETENVFRVLQNVNLRSIVPPRLYLQNLSKEQRSALLDIADILRSVCHLHRLPLALTWIPCVYTEELSDEIIKIQPRGSKIGLYEKCVLCIEDTSSYVNEKNMKGFVHACLGHYLEEGQGVCGKALKSAYPFFCPDVKEYNITEYPLVQHARKFGLNAAVAIRLKSTHTKNDDYILEFFLPITVTEATEQQLLLNSLSTTMQRICTSLRTVSETDLLYSNVSEVQSERRKSSHLCKSVKPSYNDCLSELPTLRKEDDNPCLQGPELKEKIEKKRSAAEKHVSVSVLQQYFSGSLKDAAKSIGVCPTTLKRICREHGIARWPSRKIKKVNRSLRKLQGVLDSVGSVNGGLEFNSNVGLFSTGFNVESGKSVTVPNGESASKPSKMDNENDTVEMEDKRNFRSSDKWNPNDVSRGSEFTERTNGWAPNNSRQNMNSLVVCDDTDAKPKQQNSSNKTDLSNESESIVDGSCSSSRSFQNQNRGNEASSDDQGPKITVKSSYKEDTVRFKFDPANGCYHLYEKIASRFKLQLGQFKLKYLDDEDDWIILVNDSDMRECIDVVEYQGVRHLKITVFDAVCDVGSSGGSNYIL